MERVKGIEPSQPAWKAGVLPLNYTRIDGGRDRIRTCVDIRRQIYSLMPLTTRPPFRQSLFVWHQTMLFQNESQSKISNY